MNYGYARVSTSEQETTMQIDALKRAGIKKIHHEKGSGVGPRPVLRSLLSDLQPGDVLVVWKVDRVARSLVDLLSIMGQLKQHGACLRSLTEPIDTSNAIGEFTFQILGAVAQLERSMIRERCMTGQRAAKARGVHCGRPRSIDQETEADIVCKYLTGCYTLRGLAELYGIHESAVKRAVYRVSKPGHSSLK